MHIAAALLLASRSGLAGGADLGADTIQVLSPPGSRANDRVASVVAVDGPNVVLLSLDRGIVYRKQGGDWAVDADLRLPGGVEAGRYFNSVSLSGSWCMVGALPLPRGGVISGTVYAFHRGDNGWVLQTQLSVANDADQVAFGWSVSVCDDVCVVGSSQDSSVATSAGAVYVFQRHDENWRQTAKLTVPGIPEYSSLGTSVAVDGPTCVAACVERMAGPDDKSSGSVYVFRAGGAGWVLDSRLPGNLPEAQPFQTLNPVAICSDRILIGGFASDKGPGGLIFRRVNDHWTKEAFLPVLQTPPSAWPQSVAIGDKVAAIGMPPIGACIYELDGDSWRLVRMVMVDEAASAGASVAINADACVVGAPGDDRSGEDCGAAYVIEKPLSNIPKPVAKNDVDRMNREQARAALSGVSKALQLYADDDAELAARLRKESEMIRQRLGALGDDEP